MNTKQKLVNALKIWLVIYPSITLFLFLFGQHLSVLPLPLRTLLLTLTLVPWMVFVCLPVLNRVLASFSSKTDKK